MVPMALSIGAKQNWIYFMLVLLTAIGSTVVYQWTRQEWVLFREAQKKYEDAEYEGAIALYKKSVEKGIEFSKVTIQLANSYVALGNFPEAIALYRQYLSQNPGDKQTRLALARALSWTGNLKESEEEYQKILEDKHENHQH